MAWFNFFQTSQPREPRLVMFPTICTRSPTGEWQVDLHGWVFYPHSETKIGRTIRAVVQRKLELSPSDERFPVFMQRATGFAIENSRKIQVRIRLAGQDLSVPRTKRNGHFKCSINMSEHMVSPYLLTNQSGEIYLPFSAHVDGCESVTSGQILYLQPEGTSIISDLDDTIKDSHVANKLELLANTFIRPLKSVEGMAQTYNRWKSPNTLFHYISASPWQIYPVVQEFLHQEAFPTGSIHLRKFTLKDMTFLKKLTPSHKGKRKIIEDLLTRCPLRKFVFLGDSGEKDPEMYADVARKFPAQINNIFIRNVTDEDPDSLRYRKTFMNIDSKRWQLFENGLSLPNSIQ